MPALLIPMDELTKYLVRAEMATEVTLTAESFRDLVLQAMSAAAAIRELEAKLDAERKARDEADQRAEAAEAKLREVEAWIKERMDYEHAAKVKTGRAGLLEIENAHRIQANTFKSVLLHIRALAPERAVAADFDPCAPCCEPASPLLPGLERAAEIDALEAEIHRIDYERMRMADALREILNYPLDSDVINAAAQMLRAFTSPIAAEISRIKGEGSDHEQI